MMNVMMSMPLKGAIEITYSKELAPTFDQMMGWWLKRFWLKFFDSPDNSSSFNM